MSDAKERLARSRQAILEHIARRERRWDPREEGPRAQRASAEFPQEDRMPPPRGAGWFDRARHAAGVWWRHHPAHMAAEVAGPLLASYGRRNPAKLLGIAAVAGAALMFARPWRLISLTTLLVAVVKATNLPSILMSAMSAADYEHDNAGPE
jgi:hypothetical protein